MRLALRPWFHTITVGQSRSPRLQAGGSLHTTSLKTLNYPVRRGLSAHFRRGVVPHLAKTMQNGGRGLSPSHFPTSCCLCVLLLGDMVLRHLEVLGECLEVSLLSCSSAINLWLLQPPSLLTPQTHLRAAVLSRFGWAGSPSPHPCKGLRMGVKNPEIWNGSVTKQLVTLGNSSTTPWGPGYLGYTPIKSR